MEGPPQKPQAVVGCLAEAARAMWGKMGGQETEIGGGTTAAGVSEGSPGAGRLTRFKSGAAVAILFSLRLLKD